MHTYCIKDQKQPPTLSFVIFYIQLINYRNTYMNALVCYLELLVPNEKENSPLPFETFKIKQHKIHGQEHLEF